MHAYIHTYIHTYSHTYIHTHIHTYTHTYIHTYTQAFGILDKHASGVLSHAEFLGTLQELGIVFPEDLGYVFML